MENLTKHDVSPTLQQLLTRQKASYNQQPDPDFYQRRDHIKALKSALINHRHALINALQEDYGHRSTGDSLIAEIIPCINASNYALKHLRKWMKPSRRHAGLSLTPATVKVYYQPLGVIGIMVPWNFPVMLAITPLITALAAGNRAMVKLSEFTPNTNAVIKTMLEEVFDSTIVAVIEGDAKVAAAFSALAFDHLLFTGSVAVGRRVMRAAADNLTPITLELGGKSPVLIAPDIPLEIAVDRIIYGKCLNAGQICVAPDYVLLPQGSLENFKRLFQSRFNAMYHGSGDKDYGSIINEVQFQRLEALLEDARQKGAQISAIGRQEIDKQQRKIPVQLIDNVTDEMRIMKEEIFGPLLPIIEYQDLPQAIAYINQRPRPLALYLMSFDDDLQQQVLAQTHSGGMCINDTLFHVGADDAPFGGIGSSGMGHYHGREGFLTMSHAKTVLHRGRINTGKLIRPPYNRLISRLLMWLFLR